MVATANQNVIEMDINDIQSQNILDYSMSIICGRAIADVRDGLKPVHRRTLWGMLDGGYTPDKAHKKSASIVGDVMGTYHPHGDSSIYDALVRMAQWFSNNIPVVDGHGNFGSQNGDSAAAMRYTEARLSRFSMEQIMDGIRKNAVDFIPNYDRSEKEPVVLPAKLPLLLINGSGGIASGYASEIPAHNLVEVCKMVIELIENPFLSVEDVARRIRPDFPTGGILCSNKDITDAYVSGRGSVRYRAKIEHEQTKRGKTMLVVTELPYGLTIGGVMENIVANAKPNKDNPTPPLMGFIQDIRNETKKGKMRLVIEVAPGMDPGVVENMLYQHTNLQVTLKIILVAIKRDDYFQYNVKDLFTEWISFRRETIRRMALFDVARFKLRQHIVDGLLMAQANIDAVIATIKASKSSGTAKQKLMEKFGFTEAQTDAILEMKLSKLTGLEVDKLKQERDELEVWIAEKKLLLKSPELVDKQIKEEQQEAIRKYGKFKKNKETGETELVRNTQVADIDTSIEHEDLIVDEQYLITISHNNYIKRVKHVFNSQKRGGKGTSTGKTKDGDFIERMFYANSKDHLLVFTDKGRVFDLKVWQLDEAKMTTIGSPIGKFVKLEQGESARAIVNISNEQYENQEGFLMFATRGGLVKKTSMAEFQNIRESGIIATRIREDDELLGVSYIDTRHPMQHVFLATKNGMGIRFDHEDVAPALRPTFGMKGIDLRDGDEAVSFNIIDTDECYILAISSSGLGKRTLVKNPLPVQKRDEAGNAFEAIEDKGFPVQQRNGKGRICMALKEGAHLIKTLVVFDGENVIVASTEKAINVETNNINVQLRPSYGSRIIDVRDGAAVVDVSKIVMMDEEEE